MYLFCVVLCIVCVYMCIVLLPPGGYPIAVKYIISYIISYCFFIHPIAYIISYAGSDLETHEAVCSFRNENTLIFS